MIRSHTLVDDYQYISRFDEAVDSSLADFEDRWRQYMDGAAEPPLKPGIEPARFTLRHVTNTERVYLLEMAQGDEKGLMIGAASIALVEAKGVEGPDGKPLKVARDFTEYGPHKIQHANKATMDALPVDVLLELGAVAVERMRLRPS
jgi:hypothetical protein